MENNNENIFIPNAEKREKEIVIIKRIEEIFESNSFKGLEENSLKQRLELEFGKDLIERAFEYLWDNEIIYPDKNNDNLIYFKKED